MEQVQPIEAEFSYDRFAGCFVASCAQPPLCLHQIVGEASGACPAVVVSRSTELILLAGRRFSCAARTDGNQSLECPQVRLAGLHHPSAQDTFACGVTTPVRTLF